MRPLTVVTCRELFAVTLARDDDELAPRLAQMGNHEGEGDGGGWVGWWWLEEET
jgi:hypothetical protein